MHFCLNKKRWRLVREPIRHRTSEGHRIYGICSPPDQPGRFIKIDSRLKGLDELDTILHELGHASNYDTFDEDYVHSTARGMASVLWRLGYRKLTPEQMRTLGIK